MVSTCTGKNINWSRVNNADMKHMVMRLAQILNSFCVQYLRYNGDRI